MKTMRSGILATLLFCGFLSCKKDMSSNEDLSQAKAPSVTTTQAVDGIVQSTCPTCVANFTPQTETLASNAVLKLEAGVLTAAGTTVTTIPTTVERYTVGNVNVTVSHDAQNVYFTLERNNSTGLFGNIRFYSPAVIPIVDNGPGRFGFATEVKKIQVIRSREALPACSEISFSFMVKGGGNPTVAGEVTTTEALKYVLRDICPVKTCTIAAGDYRTQTRGYWRNNNGQAFVTAHPGLLPLTIGDGNNTQSFADAASVKTFLESGIANGTPGVLPNGGTLAAQVLTLAINLKADEQVATFGAADGKLANLVVNIDDADITAHQGWAALKSWNGKSVQEIFALAQKVLGGTSTAYSPSQMNDVVTAINENFDNGSVNNGFLGCGQ
ncbi:hypothetical protein [Flavisolibacter nicotianae]|uniref:hypothetical protein n=1 Tax=Flavisolibacter nicotianae TaxID=2364882 RepID=UPI000EACCA8B|nr:hypothetical protein [Flavisolibacter nicotianae]